MDSLIPFLSLEPWHHCLFPPTWSIIISFNSVLSVDCKKFSPSFGKFVINNERSNRILWWIFRNNVIVAVFARHSALNLTYFIFNTHILLHVIEHLHQISFNWWFILETAAIFFAFIFNQFFLLLTFKSSESTSSINM